MNIVEVCLNPSLGGLELYFSWCSEYFHQSKHNILSVTLPDSRLSALLKESGVPTEPIQPSVFFHLYAAHKLAKICEQHRADVVHVHYKNDLPIAALAKRWSRQKFKLIHTRQMEMPGNKRDFYHRWIYSQVDHLLCITDRLREEVLEKTALPEDRVSRLYYGVKEPTGNSERARGFFKEFPSNKIKVAMFSRLERSKGQWRLLQALEKAQKSGSDFQIYFFGHSMDDRYVEELKKYIEDHKLTSSIYWCGFQKQPLDLMPFFDVVTLPSDQETFGIVLIEAMAAGVAVIGTRSGGVPEIIDDGQTGFLFSPDSLDEYASKLIRLTSDPLLRKSLVDQAKIKYQKLFRYEDHFLKLESIFEKAGSSH